MWLTLRKTVSRGRALVPAIRFRCRSWMRTRRTCFVLIFIALLRSCLSSLLLEHFPGVAHALLLVRIRLAQAATVRRHLSDELPVDAAHRDVRLLVDRDVDPGGDVEHDRVRVAQGEHNLFALDLRAVADADDVELPLEAVGHAGDGVRHETSRQAVQLLQLRVLARGLRNEMAVGQLEVDAHGMRLTQFTLRALHLNRAVNHLDGDALGNRDRLLSNSRHKRKLASMKFESQKTETPTCLRSSDF